MKAIYLLLVFLIITFSEAAFASDFLFYKELNLMGGYSNEEGFIGESSTLSNSIGFEHYGKFSGEYGD